MLYRLFILMLLMAPSLRAAEQPLLWEDCVRLASVHNPALSASAASVDAARSGVQVARSALRPQLSADAAAEQNYQQEDEGQNQTAYGVALSVEQSLYSGGRTRAEVRSAQAGLDLENASLANSQADVTYALRRAFIDVLYVQDRVVLLGQIQIRRANNLELVELRYEGGREHKGSLASSEASLFDAQVQGRQATRAVSVTRQVLARTMGIPALSAERVVTGELAQPVEVEGADIEAMARETPVYLQAQATCKRAEALLANAQSRRRPEVSLVGSAGRYGNEDAFEEDRATLGLRVTFPFWSGGKEGHEINQTRANLRKAESDAADILNERVRILAEAEQSLEDAAEEVDVQAKYGEAAELRAQIARQQYEDGLLSFDDWTVIEDDLISKKESLLDARQGALMAEAAWWQASGHEVFSQIRDETGGEG